MLLLTDQRSNEYLNFQPDQLVNFYVPYMKLDQRAWLQNRECFVGA
jgi:hypothetical protein